jgi:hypothetical protein
MKKNILFLLVLFQVSLFAQEYKSNKIWQYIGYPGFSEDQADFLSMAYSPVDSLPWVAFEDFNHLQRISVKRFNGNSWDYVGTPGFSNFGIFYSELAFSPVDRSPYVVYTECWSKCLGIIKRFDGTSWSTLGNQSFSTSDVGYTKLAFNPSDGLPYVAFTDYGNSSKATVKKFDGSLWVNVGPAGFTSTPACFISLAFDTLGMPYISYSSDFHNPGIKASVMKYNGSQWEYVGMEGISSGSAEYTDMAFSSSGILYLAYQDSLLDRKVSVKKFDGLTWSDVGQEGFSHGITADISLALSPKNEPYIAFNDRGNFCHASVMKFDGLNWVNVGPPGFTIDTATFTKLVFNYQGNPCLVFQDWGYSAKASAMLYDFPLGYSEASNTSLSLYPNPASNFLTIDMNLLGNSEKRIDVINPNGVIILTKKTNNSKLFIDINDFPDGLYFLNVISCKITYLKKFVKNRNL